MIKIFKYHGAGNDFVLIDNRRNIISPDNNKLIKNLCTRRFGVGADGLMLLMNSENFDFEMKYYNSDGFEGTMCGNGGRCIVAFAKDLGIIKNKTNFISIDGPHQATIDNENNVNLQMSDVKNVERIGNDFLLDTGSPHYVKFISDIDNYNVIEEGRKIREKYNCNANFAELTPNGINIRTFERGVEDETWACGTGIVATAIASSILNNTPVPINMFARGGNLRVDFEKSNNTFNNIWKFGPTQFVFDAEVSPSYFDF